MLSEDEGESTGEAAATETAAQADDGAAQTAAATMAEEATADGEADGGAEAEDVAQTESESAADADLPLASVIEAILFAARRPFRLEDIARGIGRRIRKEKIREAIAELNHQYQAAGRAFEIEEVAQRFALMSRPEYAAHIRRALGEDKEEKKPRMSAAMLDTLSIIAYKQPVTRAEIETVRGVASGPILRSLIERGSVKVVGKKTDVIGHPLLYGTTQHFLEEFGLASLDELPMVEELRGGAAARPLAAEATAVSAAEQNIAQEDAAAEADESMGDDDEEEDNETDDEEDLADSDDYEDEDEDEDDDGDEECEDSEDLDDTDEEWSGEGTDDDDDGEEDDLDSDDEEWDDEEDNDSEEEEDEDRD